MGKCPGCGEWNTLTEEIAVVDRKPVSAAVSFPITSVDETLDMRFSSGIAEFDQAVGGGIVVGSVTLIGGEPGIGKSTLLLQIASKAAQDGETLYVSGEESPRQVRMRAERIGAAQCDSLLLSTETNAEAICSLMAGRAPKMAVVDSIQTVHTEALDSAPGSIAQVRACAAMLHQTAKEHGVALFLVGHVTKEGFVAGPKALEHLVDTVLYFEGEGSGAIRALRAVKNRFGPTNELGVFEMSDKGLTPVDNPSSALLAERATSAPGSIIFPTLVGSRCLLTEVQALTTPSFLNSPRRVVSGLSYDRVSLVLAVLEKRLGLRMGAQDVFVNVAGGVKIQEPAADLAIALAAASSMRDRPLPQGLVAMGELGLAGEVRSINSAEPRLKEAARLGFEQAALPKGNYQRAGKMGIELMGFRTLAEAVKTFLTD